MSCTAKWIGQLDPAQVAVLNVRPDGYVGFIQRWDTTVSNAGEAAARSLDEYYGGFLHVPAGT